MDDLAGVAAMEGELDPRMLVEESSEQSRENVLRNRGRNAERQLPGDVPVLGAKLLFRLGNEFRYLPGIGEQERSLRREGDAIAGAIKETDAEIVFESFDLKRYGGLGEEKVFRRLAKVQMFATVRNTLRRKFSS
ncbi:MAG: hypothetical protein WB781_16785 [Candidatus Sulfotelmatobacter sp.]